MWIEAFTNAITVDTAFHSELFLELFHLFMNNSMNRVWTSCAH